VQSDKLEDSSFSIALKQLRKAKSDLAEHGRSLSLRCFFLEENRDAYESLKQFAANTADAVIETRNATLEQSVKDISDFVKRGGDSSFPFVFVDPTGWTGFAMDVIAPLLRLNPGEVLVNFMTGHILRFAEHPDPAMSKTFDRLFGSIDYRSRIGTLAGQDREDELVRCYMDAIRETGGFDYLCSALVLHPVKDRTHFHLIYATRNRKGVEVFKQVEKKAMTVMEKARANAQQRCRVTKTGQKEFSFGSAMMHSGDHYEHLRDRYLGAARQHVDAMLTQRKRVLFDDAWIGALQFPLVWENDVKAWIRDWVKDGRIRLEGLSPSDRVPKRENNHWLVLTADLPGDVTK
jgi:three-Cys-motif partner protein